MPGPRAFAEASPFPLDPFQLEAIEALDDGASVLVAAPTGAGKTVVAEFAIADALDRGAKCFYTTPLKALSNQKFGDLVARHGPDAIGLLTGDNAINSEAPIVVMTTEILRNMLYAGSRTLEGLRTVVMDEVHYLQDPYRGAVWEEVLIHLPPSVAVVCLSATISNAEEFGAWLGELRGTTRVVIEEKRPVAIEHHYLVGRDLHPMHVDVEGRPAANPYLVALDREEARQRRDRRGGGQRRRRGRTPGEGERRVWVPRREEVVEVLRHAGMLPAIYFVFSRAGCDRSVEFLLESGVRLTTPHEAARIREIAEERAAWIDGADLDALGFGTFLEALAAGVASHHAGMLPIFKQTVEELFAAGLVKVVFATETLSLGINMPARTVVIEDLWKFQGERHELLTPGEYTQLTGRAGRRGIDEIGHAVVVYQRQVEFDRVASLASTRTYELTSSFRPSYNMAVNLVRNYTREQAHTLLNGSFAQFLVDRGVASLDRHVERDRTSLDGFRTRMVCDRGDFREYWLLRREAESARRAARGDAREARRQAVREAMTTLRPGDVIGVPGAGRRGIGVVLSLREGRPTVLAEDRTLRRLGVHDLGEAPAVLARVALPRMGNVRSARFRRDLAARLAALDVRAPERTKPEHVDPSAAGALRLDRAVHEHPCHACPDRPDHERWAARADAMEQQIAGLERRVKSRTDTLARQFDRVLRVLERLGYVEGFQTTPKGEMLSRIYGEADVLVAETLAAGLFEGLTGPEAAALASTLVYESRERTPRAGSFPTARTRERAERLAELWRGVRSVEDANHVELVRDVDAGFADIAFAWAEGKSLEDVLGTCEMAPGDFVRTCKQLLDLLRQIESVAPPAAADAVGRARSAVDRGVVAYAGM